MGKKERKKKEEAIPVYVIAARQGTFFFPPVGSCVARERRHDGFAAHRPPVLPQIRQR